MPFKKGEGGRPRGAKNKLTIQAKEAFEKAFDEIGGWEGLANWAKQSPENMKAFYQLYSKLIPMEHSGSVQVPTVQIVKSDG